MCELPSRSLFTTNPGSTRKVLRNTGSKAREKLISTVLQHSIEACVFQTSCCSGCLNTLGMHVGMIFCDTDQILILALWFLCMKQDRCRQHCSQLMKSNKRALHDLKLIPWQIQGEWQICSFGVLTWEGEDWDLVLLQLALLKTKNKTQITKPTKPL